MSSKEKRVKRETVKLVVLNEEELIRQVELRPILYDKSLKGYRKSALRYQYWKEVSEVIGARVEECRRRWRSLRDAFSKHYKYLNRIEDATQSKRKKWVFYDQMSFIASYLDSSYCEIEDTLLEDFPDNSDDGQSIILHETNENCHITTLDTIDGSNRQQIESEDKSNIKDTQNSTSDEHQYIASILDHGTTGTPETVLLHHPLQLQEENTKKENSCTVLGPSLHQTEVLSSTSPSTTSSIAMCLDSDEKFLLSCAPILRRLTHRKNALARLKIQQILYDIEFESEGR